MIQNTQIATFPQSKIRNKTIVFSLLSRYVVRQHGFEKHFADYFNADVMVFSIEEHGIRKALMICYHYKMNQHISVVHNCKMFYSQGEREVYKLIFYAFIKHQIKKHNFIFSEKKFEKLMQGI